MGKSKIIINFSRLRDSELDQKAEAVITALTGNVNFPTPLPTLESVQQALTDYTLALTDAANKDRVKVELKNLKRTALEDILSNLGLYVQFTSAGDLTKMLSSGFDISKDPSPIGSLPKPANFKAEVNGPGSVKVMCNTVKGADAYQWEWKEVSAPTGEWESLITSKSKAIINSLTSGKEYSFRAVAIGSDPSRRYSDELKSFVL